MSGSARGTQNWILLAHQSDELRAGLISHLQVRGHHVVDVADGAQAVERLRREPPCLAVLQADLPIRSGIQISQALRSHPLSASIPILLIAGADASEGLAAGADDLLDPATPADWLAHRIAHWLDFGGSRELLDNTRHSLRALQHLAGIATWELDVQSGAFQGSEEIQRLFGFEAGEKINLELLLSRVPPEDRQVVRSFVHLSCESGQSFSVETEIELPEARRVIHWRGEYSKGRNPRIVGSVQDVTERTRAEQQVRHLAYHDGLTGLSNRNAFTEHLGEALALGTRHRRNVALLFLDLDHFKRINDSLGHSTGDQILIEVARRLDACVRQSDLMTRSMGMLGGVSRLGGDEFTVLLSEVNAAEDAARVARRILEALAEPIMIDQNELRVGVSIGITMFPGDGTEVDTLLRNADIAMYHAKEQGRSNIQFFSEELCATEHRRSAIEDGLNRALDEDGLLLSYQPQIDVYEGRVVGVEALLRWRDPGMGVMSPAEFVPVAEDAGLIQRIGEWALSHACRRAQSWNDAGLPPIRMSVNMSPRQFESEAIVELVGQTLFDTGLPARQLVLEVTETVFTRDPESVARMLRELRKLGVGISLDDFGTGYSSLSYLKRFPVGEIKIDHSFVRDVPLDPDDSSIIQAILSIGETLGLGVVAEGVESPEQCAFLRQLGCRYMQGHLFSPAMDGSTLGVQLLDGTLESRAQEMIRAGGR